MKKQLALLLAVALMLAFVGCESDSGTAAATQADTSQASGIPAASGEEAASIQSASSVYPLTDKLETITFWGSDQSSQNTALPTFNNVAGYAFWSYVEEQTGVHLELTTVSKTVESEQLNLMLASGDYRDIMNINASLVSGGMSYLLSQNIITDMADYVKEYMPNYYGFISESEEKTKLSYNDDGQMYGARAFAEEYVPNQGLVIREDMVKALGMEMPTTIDGLYSVLTAFKTQYDMSSAFWLPTSSQSGKHIVGAMGTPGFSADFGSQSDHLYQADGVVKSGLTDDGYLEYLKLMNKWYKEGLFLSDYFTQTDMDANSSSVLNNQTGVLNAMYGQALTLQDSLQADNESAMLYAIPTPEKNEGEENPYYSFSALSNSTWWCVSGDCKNIELTLRYMDWWFGEDGFYTANYGVEGLSYEFDEDGKPYYTEAVTKNEWGIDAASAIEAYVSTNPIIGIVQMDRSVYLVGEQWVTDMLDIWVDQANDSCSLPTGLSLSSEESEAVSSKLGDIATYATENVTKFVTGEKDFSEWDSYIADMKSMGLQDVIDTYQTAYDRYKSR